jgi:uncharacterized glyoxalase superfamily protein PhnB
MHIYPCLRYRDAPAAIEWLERAFGLRRGLVVPGPEGTIAHAELRFGQGMIMLGSPREDTPAAGPATLYLATADLDAHHARAAAAGATILRQPFDTDYGSRDYIARDPEGHVWCFGTYDPLANPG